MANSQGKAIDLELRLESGDVLRNMGCRKGATIRPEHRELVERLMAETTSVLQPRGTYCIQPVTRMTDLELVLAEQRCIRGPIAGFLKPAVRVAAFVVTVGDEIERVADRHMRDGSRLEGYILNAIGSAAADAAVDALADVIYFEEAAPEEALTPPFSPGYCGLPLDEQISLFAILNAKALGNAASVTSVDLDEDALELARKNANLNQVRIKYVHSDAFGYLRQMQTGGQKYDMVVLDPPKFVSNRDEFAEGGRKYGDLNALGMTVVKPGGLLVTCSCSGSVARQPFLDIVKASAHRAGRTLQIVDQTGAGSDHPVMANCPESEYLKAVWARVL